MVFFVLRVHVTWRILLWCVFAKAPLFTNNHCTFPSRKLDRKHNPSGRVVVPEAGSRLSGMSYDVAQKQTKHRGEKNKSAVKKGPLRHRRCQRSRSKQTFRFLPIASCVHPSGRFSNSHFTTSVWPKAAAQSIALVVQPFP